MKLEQLARYDIKLLVALQVLIEEKNVSRAAARLNVTQSAMSKMLARLKETFGSELFIRTHHGIEPTEHALALQIPLIDAIESLNNLFSPSVFEPYKCQRVFRLTLIDNRLIPGLLRTLSQQAPDVSIQLKPWSQRSMNDLAEGKLDLVMNMLEVERANFYQHKLEKVQVRAIVRKGHPLENRTEITLDEFLTYSFIKVIVPEFNENNQPDKGQLSALGKERRIVFETSDINCALRSVTRTDYIFLGSRGSYEEHHQELGLTTIVMPKEMAESRFTTKFIWHQRQHIPADQIWFRNLVIAEYRELIDRQQEN
jgi:DNA-binding transcriptional LysR family regulator